MTTKVRSVVERVFGILKNNKEIENLRNTVISHLGIDLRKAAVFDNYTHKPLTKDKPQTQKVARRLKEQAINNRNNHLQLLLNLILSTKRLFSSTNLNIFEDLIPLKRKYLRKKVLCGSFRLNMAKSYMHDFVNMSKAYEFNPPKKYKSILEPNTKIVAIKLNSRYKRSMSKKYISEGKIGIDQFNKINKVYIQYKPWTELYQDRGRQRLKNGYKKCDAIRGWICTCLNGRRRGGTCSYTATNHMKSNHPNYAKRPRGENDIDSGSSTDNSTEDEEYVAKNMLAESQANIQKQPQTQTQSELQSTLPKQPQTQSELKPQIELVPQTQPYFELFSDPDLFLPRFGGQITFKGQ